MERLRPFIFLYAIWTLFSVRSSTATLVPALDLEALSAQADVIAVGRIAAVREEGSMVLDVQGSAVAARQMLANLVVERMIHGSAPEGRILFKFVLPDMPIGYEGIQAGLFGVFFLRKVTQGYEILNPYYPFVVAVPGAPARTGDYVDQVTAQVSYVLDSATATPDMRLQAVMVLRTVRTPLAAGGLKSAAAGSDLRARASALGALLRRNDISVLDSAQELMLSQDPRIEQNLKNSVASGLGDGVKDPRAIPALARLLLARDVGVRRGAAAALRNTHDTAAINPLMQALYDSDQQVLYLTVVGLGEITGQDDWTPSIDYFNRNQARFLQHWREWAKAQK